MFEVQESRIGRFISHKLINGDTGEYLEVLTGFGAGINDLVINNGKGELISVIDGYRSEDDLMQNHHTLFKGSKLSPFPNRVFGGTYSHNGQKYQLPINEVAANNHLHALLHNKPFVVEEIVNDSQKAQLTLKYDYKGIDQGYPFPYALTIFIEFTEGRISIKSEIENLSESEIPLGDGWHPYFKFDNLNDIQLQMGKAELIYSGFDNPLSKSNGYESTKKIGASKLDECFKVNENGKFNLVLKDESNDISLDVWQETSDQAYKYLQIFIPEHRKSIAIEPVTCPPNAMNTKESIINLKSNQKVSMSFGINFSN